MYDTPALPAVPFTLKLWCMTKLGASASMPFGSFFAKTLAYLLSCNQISLLLSPDTLSKVTSLCENGYEYPNSIATSAKLSTLLKVPLPETMLSLTP